MSDKAEVVPVPAEVLTAERLAEAVRGFEVTDERTLREAVEAASLLKEAAEQAETARVFLVKPLNDHVNRINGTFNPKLKAIKATMGVLKGRIAGYHEDRQRERNEAARQLADFVGQSEEVQEIVSTVPAPRQVAVAASGAEATTAERWNYEVEDLRALCREVAEGRLPLSVVTVDKGGMRRWLNALDKRSLPDDSSFGDREPAVRVFKVKDVRIR